MKSAYIYLALAIVLEVVATACMKASDSFKNWIPTAFMVVCYGLCFTAMTFALKKIDVSVAYAIWSGVGTALIALVGILYFKEALSIGKAISLLLIIAGVVGLNMFRSSH